MGLLDSLCFPYNLGYVHDEAFPGQYRFFITWFSQKQLNEFRANVQPPKTTPEKLIFAFFEYLRLKYSDPITTIRNGLTTVDEFAEGKPLETSDCWLALLATVQTSRDTAITTLNAADKTLKEAEAALADDGMNVELQTALTSATTAQAQAAQAKDLSEEIFQKVNDKANYVRCKGNDVIAGTTLQAWGRWSNVTDYYYPIAADQAQVGTRELVSFVRLCSFFRCIRQSGR